MSALTPAHTAVGLGSMHQKMADERRWCQFRRRRYKYLGVGENSSKSSWLGWFCRIPNWRAGRLPIGATCAGRPATASWIPRSSDGAGFQPSRTCSIDESGIFLAESAIGASIFDVWQTDVGRIGVVRLATNHDNLNRSE